MPARGPCARTTVHAHVSAPPNPHPRLLALEPIQSADTLAVNGPTLVPQQHGNSLVAEARLGMREIANPQCQRTLIARLKLPIPRRPRELRLGEC
jgi:hypothetical protein